MSAATSSVTASAASLGPFDLAGGAFLALYAGLLVLTIIAGFVIPRRLRPAGRPQTVTDMDQLAWLAGGRTRFGDALVARLLAARALIMYGKDMFAVTAPEVAVTPAERSVVALPSPMHWSRIEETLRAYAQPLERKLADAGLIMSRIERANLRFWAVLPYLMLIAFGITKWMIGTARDKPVGFLTALLVVTTIFALIRFFTVDRRTQAGIDAVEQTRTRSQRLKAAPTMEETGLAVALFGTAVLVGSGWGDFHRLRGDSGSSSGGDSGGDGGGGGGCGGGGCGGCGG